MTIDVVAANTTLVASTTCDIRKFVERDIDLLIAEELRVNAEFSAWIMSHFSLLEPLVHPAISVNVSDVEDGSEADVAASFHTVTGRIHRLFVENKIDAGLMPSQLERYARRGRGEVARGAASSFSVLFFTPSNYASKDLPVDVWQLSFEAVAAYLRTGTPDARASYRASLLDRAVPVYGSKARDAQVATTEPYIKAWWDAVYLMLDDEFPGFFKHGTRYPRSVYFAPETHNQASYLRVDFKGHKGEVDLAFKNVLPEALRSILKGLDQVPGVLVANGKSSALQIGELESFVISEGHAIIPTKVRRAYSAAHRLLTFWQSNRLAFDAALLT